MTTKTTKTTTGACDSGRSAEKVTMRTPFPPHQISKLPKPTKAQNDAVKANFRAGIRCEICGGWHHPDVVHLDYVGHAALTDRLLDVDPNWNWEPLAYTEEGLPRLDAEGGLWIKLTVLGVTRLGYGDAQGKTGGDAMKERIGDALRNAAMRFGAALDLWHKGPLHIDEDEPAMDAPQDAPQPITDDQAVTIQALAEEVGADIQKFLQYLAKRGKVRITTIEEIPASMYRDAVAALEAKRAR